MKRYAKIGLVILAIVLSLTFLTGCDGGGVIIPPVVSSYTVYFSSYDGVSGYLYIDGINEGYLYPYSSLQITLSAGSHSVSLNGTFCGYVNVSYSGETFYIDSYYNVW